MRNYWRKWVTASWTTMALTSNRRHVNLLLNKRIDCGLCEGKAEIILVTITINISGYKLFLRSATIFSRAEWTRNLIVHHVLPTFHWRQSKNVDSKTLSHPFSALQTSSFSLVIYRRKFLRQKIFSICGKNFESAKNQWLRLPLFGHIG